MTDRFDRVLTTCHRCGGRFPGPGVHLNRQVYCCDKCAAGPGAKARLGMPAAAAALVGLGALLGWSAARARR